MFRWLSLILPVAALSCGSKAVDLDGGGGDIVASPDPSVLGTVREDIGQIAVDRERVYWLAGDRRVNSDGGGLLTLRGCEKATCAASLVTFVTQGALDVPGFGVVGNEVYWFQDRPPNTLLGVPSDGKTYLLASATTGGGTTRVVSDHAETYAATFDEDAVYISGLSETDPTQTEIDVISLPAGGEPRQVAVLGDQGVVALQARGDYLYWIYGYARSRCSIQRTLKDGTGIVETLAEDLEINAPQAPLGPVGGLAVDSSYFYWAENTLTGALKRCPLSGCGGSPETLLSPVRSPTGMLLDGSTLYFLHELDAYSYAISRCATDGCAASVPLMTDVDSTNVLAVDDQYLYSATTAQYLGVDESMPPPVAQIRRVAK